MRPWNNDETKEAEASKRTSGAAPAIAPSRRELLGSLAGAVAWGAVAGGSTPASAAVSLAAGETTGYGATASTPPEFELAGLSVSELQAGLATGRWTSRRLVELYLARIAAVDRGGPRVNAVAETNPDALALADALDHERKVKGPRGALHGIPVLIKDNIDTGDGMRTTAGSLALAESIAPRDSHVAEQLRKAGAVVLGKTNLSEWANFRSTHSTSGWSGRGGQVRNPYALDRNPCGSSSGTGAGIASDLAAIGVGTETDGSVTCPSSMCGLVGIKPTVGLVSRAGIVPIAHSQDTAGPMTRTVADAAILLTALAGEDPRDPATAGTAKYARDFTRALDPKGLAGARIGVARNFWGYHREIDRQMEAILATLKRLGAELVDPAEVPHAKELDDPELEVLLFEFKHDLEAYLAGLSPLVKPRTMADLVAWNSAHAAQEMPYFGQELFEKAAAKGPLTDPAYLDALAKCRKLSRDDGIDAILDQHRLDALVAPTMGPAYLTDWVLGDGFTGASTTPSAVAGYPHVTVPAGDVFGLPWGLSFLGPAWSEAKLLRYAFAFEQETKSRKPPRFLPTVAFAS